MGNRRMYKKSEVKNLKLNLTENIIIKNINYDTKPYKFKIFKMLKKLKVKNFRSLKDFEVIFGKFNVLIGRNNTGKSNIIDVLSFLNDGITTSNSFKQRGGYKNVVFGKNTANNIEINAIFEEDFYEDNFLFDYYLKFDGEYSMENPVEEKLEIQKNNGEKERFPKSENKRLYLFGKQNIKEYPLIDGKSKIEEIKKQIEETERMTAEEYTMGILGAFFYTILYNLRYYKIVPYNIKPQINEVFVEKNLQLDKECKNIPLFLLSLSQNDRKKLDRINELLSGVVDEIDEFVPTIEGPYCYLKMKDKNFNESFYSGSISEGTISLLSYITIIETSKKQSIICFEEPEKYIHARLLEFIVDLMKNTDAQIIVTTHSLSFIDLCDPEDIIIVEKEKGETKAKRINDPKKLREELDEIGITLGESYFSDELKNE
ncbi:MAG: hypothetical protein CVT89_02650 [Candidatus Altiarchaeales archaeon HGW-Altiarchaeales-2]|nr:MAG: hypothetical protein CVT89_02650 [Candidatus Altiarchaeales archaeon HGW-Altiarchaeales-2]